jgi:hypothetical protein
VTGRDLRAVELAVGLRVDEEQLGGFSRARDSLAALNSLIRLQGTAKASIGANVWGAL